MYANKQLVDMRVRYIDGVLNVLSDGRKASCKCIEDRSCQHL